MTRAVARRIREASRLRPFVPEAVGASNLVDRRRGPIVRRLLRIARDKRRAAALAARRGLALWDGSTAQRFEQLFVERTPRAAWLLDEAGHRVAWLGGGETIELATLSLRTPPPVIVDRTHARRVGQLHALVADVSRPPKPRGRPRGRRDTRPRLAVSGFTRPDHYDLARALRQARAAGLGRGEQLFRALDSEAGRVIVHGKPRALLEAIRAQPNRVRALARLRQRFAPPT
jgi:hypothetical protein